jgi:hypothetical protein
LVHFGAAESRLLVQASGDYSADLKLAIERGWL